MMQPKELQKLGEKLANDYLQHGVDLNTGLEKAASAYGLNRNQLHRVAEVANVKTHLEMLKTAEKEAYIEFDVADPSRVSKVEPIKVASYTNDYEKPPVRGVTKYISIFEESIEKKASQKEDRPDPSARYNEAVTKQAAIDKLSNQCLQGSIKLENQLPTIYGLVKQAALNGTPTDSLAFIIKEAAPLGEYVIDYISKDLEKDGINLPTDGLEKFANKKINTDNELYQKIQTFNDDAIEILKVAEELKEKIDQLGDEHLVEKVAKSRGLLAYTGSQIKNLMSFTAKHKKFVGGAGLYTVGRVQGASNAKEPTLSTNLIQRNSKKVRY